ncbi:MAG: DUF6095 family protein [Flavobacteriaceae bacterium]
MKDKEKLTKGIQTVGVSVAIIILAPILLTMGFKGIALETPLFGYILLLIGFIAAIAGMILMVKGIKYFLDHWFEQ